MKRVLIVFGTRPEAIKMAPVVRALRQRSDAFQVTVCVTGQHRQMLDQVLALFDIQPEFDLSIMKAGQTLDEIVSAILPRLTHVITKVEPDLVMVHGDTTTTLAASMAAYFKRVPVAHVEAGLRTGDIFSPWPEEFNRKAAGILANWHFAPTEAARRNLMGEGAADDRIWVTGNTVIDALLHVRDTVRAPGATRDGLIGQFAFLRPDSRMVLITNHRRENFGKSMEGIFAVLAGLARQYPDVDFVFPVHLNPNVREPADRLLSNCVNIHMIEPVDYPAFVYLMDRSSLIVTDSGGVQEEAPSLSKPVILTRAVTERPEAVDAGGVLVVGDDQDALKNAVTRLLNSEAEYQKMSSIENPYGDGRASSRIADVLQSTY